jgi:hypothetical protein
MVENIITRIRDHFESAGAVRRRPSPVEIPQEPRLSALFFGTDKIRRRKKLALARAYWRQKSCSKNQNAHRWGRSRQS